MVRNVVLAGATGEIGRQLAARLAAREDLATRALVRRAGALEASGGLSPLVFDYGDGGAFARLFAAPCDLLLIALGTTRAAAGSDAAFLRVDRDHPLQLIGALAAANPAARVGLVSSVGADRPRGLYLGAKAAVEAGLAASGLAHVIARPSLLRSARAEFRPVEVLSDRLVSPWLLALGRAAFPQSRAFWRWAPVHVREVAGALLAASLALAPGERRVLEGPDLHPGPVTTWGKP